MSTLLLKLAAPLQSWGDFSRFTRRTTRHEPTKSAVLGLIAAAQGRRRTDPIEDLLSLKFGVRIDQEGVMLRDFHTARRNNNGSMPLSDRFYLSDAIYVAGLETEQITLEGIADSLMHPVFPLFLGRRSCAPSGKLVLGISDEALIPSLRNHPWEASLWYKQKKARESPGEVRLELIRDAVRTSTNVQSSLNFNEYDIKNDVASLYTAQQDWHQMLALPVSILVFFLIGAPLGAIIRKGGLGMPIVVSVVFFLIYYVVSLFGEKLAREGTWDAFWGTWLSTLVLCPIAALLTWKSTNDSQLFNVDRYYLFFQKIKGFFVALLPGRRQ